ncbi:MAG TPA: hypothetical protein VFI95_20755, partial [Terriglobales bacterium]|nr:hypothetical protein [Terriglobales bacterium]
MAEIRAQVGSGAAAEGRVMSQHGGKRRRGAGWAKLSDPSHSVHSTGALRMEMVKISPGNFRLPMLG